MYTTVFWILLSIVIYTYLGYTLILFFISLFIKKKENSELLESDLPEVSLLIAAFNEKDILEKKIKNSNELNYPKEKIHHVWITDGSTDETNLELLKHKNIKVLHQEKRMGKTAALNRAMSHIETPITVFCDANTILHPNSILQLVNTLNQPNVGCVAGEKHIVKQKKDKASSAGEGFYWNYESVIKNLESKVGSTIGAAGELFAIKTNLYEPPKTNTIVDDFVISLRIALKGYKIKYQPLAVASEQASIDISEEKKRKIRIAAGGFQVLFNMPELLNIFKYGKLSFQYISHKVLRWFFVPIAIPLLTVVNLLILFQEPTNKLFSVIFILQLIFFFLALMGGLLQKNRIRLKLLFIPYYLIIMNYTLVIGFIRYIKGQQNAAWEKARRSK